MPKALLNTEARNVAFIFEDEVPAVAADAEKGVAAVEFKPSRDVFDVSKVSQAMLIHLALHGAKQKIADSYAGAKESGTNPLAYAKEAVKETIAQLYSTENGGKDVWSVGRTGSGAPRTTFLVQAFAEATGQSIEAAQETIGGLTDEEKTALGKKPKIAAIVAKFKATAAVAKAEELAKKAAEAEAKEAQTAAA